METIIQGVISAVIGGIILVVMTKIIESLRTDNSVKLGALGAKVNKVEAKQDKLFALNEQQSKDISENNLQTKLLKTKMEYLAQSFNEFKENYKEDKAEFKNHGKVSIKS